jgi:hypothetical protein
MSASPSGLRCESLCSSAAEKRDYAGFSFLRQAFCLALSHNPFFLQDFSALQAGAPFLNQLTSKEAEL